MADTYIWPATWLLDVLRVIFGAIDNIIYGLLNLLYQLFFNVATQTSDLFSNEMVMRFFHRVQLIIGIFMMFQLAMSIIKGIMNPDGFVDNKTGFGNIITRIIISLVMLTLLVPINIPSPKNEYEKQINNNGILFGTLYSLQYRILSNNTVGRLVLGSSSDDYNYTKKNSNLSDMESSSRSFTNAILKSFIRPNLWYSKYPVELNDCICRKGDGMGDALQVYQEEDADPAAIIGFAVETKCVMEGTVDIPFYSGNLLETQMYGFVYSFFLSTIVGILCVFYFISYVIEVAKRSIKLSILRLIAPIPIISYMDSKGTKDGAFNSWVKLLIKTYLDLFVRLIIIYFIVFVIRALLTSDMRTNLMQQGALGVFTFVAIIIGLLAFAKEAPKFLKEALGLKDAGFKMFGGLSDIMAAGALAGGTIGSFNTSRNSSWNADYERAKANGMTEAQARAYANNALNRGKHLVAGLFGAGAGAATGWGAYANAKDHEGRAVRDAINARNKKIWDAGRNGGTFFGGVGSELGQLFRGENAYDQMEARWKAEEQKLKDRELVNKKDADINAYRKAIMDRVSSKAVDSDKISGTYSSTTYGDIHGSYRNWHSVSQAALTNGVGVTKNAAGEDVFMYDGKEIRVADIGDLDYGMLDAAKDAYYKKALADRTFDGEITDNKDAYEASGKTIETDFGGANGLKSKFGEENRRINKSSSEISEARANINNERQSFRSQRAQSNSTRFKNK